MLMARGMKPHNTALVSSVMCMCVCVYVCVWGLGQMEVGGGGLMFDTCVLWIALYYSCAFPTLGSCERRNSGPLC